jgi:hypothetical protein
LALRDYEKQRKKERFDPRDIGVENAHIWNTINKQGIRTNFKFLKLLEGSLYFEALYYGKKLINLSLHF